MANEMDDEAKPAIQDPMEKWMMVQIQIDLRTDFLAQLKKHIEAGDQAQALEALACVQQSVRCNDALLKLIFEKPPEHLTLTQMNNALTGRFPGSTQVSADPVIATLLGLSAEAESINEEFVHRILMKLYHRQPPSE